MIDFLSRRSRFASCKLPGFNPLTVLALAIIACGLLTGNPVPACQDHDETPIELSGFSMSQAYDIPDDQPLDLDSPILKQLLYRIKRTSPESRSKYSEYSQSLSWQDISEKTEDHRLWVFDRPATLKKITKYRFDNLSPDEEVKGVFVCHCESISDPKPEAIPSNDDVRESSAVQSEASEPTGRGQTFIVLSRTMPRGLKIDTPINEPVRVVGFLYSRISGMDAGDKNELPVFITDRLAWFPTEPSEDVSAAHLDLTNHGVDLGLLDSVEQNNTRPLGSSDAEAFFQFLGAVNRMDGTGGDTVEPKLGFTDLMRNANSNFGEAVRIQGFVRTCSVIPVPHADIQNRIGVSQYYQLMLFPDLDGAKVVVKSKDGEQLDYRRFPVTVCCTELPEGMTPQDMERKPFVVDGYFFRFWKYQSDKTDSANASGQVSPLIIIKRPIPLAAQANGLDTILVAFVVLLIVGTAVLLMVYRFGDRQREKSGARVLASLPDQIDVTGIEQ